ncbi:hypothetical protein NZD89_09195 [Alicyclobacillus fastidiosus]|uniref:Uncharacterized protein n=1 Tax=Alicyclobacillus fastidiosus TaxID=392011 RepID=A0ABY6ZNZ7_9BACL|nr:hypothetical protein [Alicyclobacillus fastidiosus]WAH44559.1 hypothetical protein NZD89_09195 [Alicyclobacillus fastidiosus]
MKRPQPKATTTEMMVSRQAQEVQAAMVIAKRFPRDQYQAFNRIMEACERRKLAEESTYEYSRGSSKVSGPSIRLAEVLAQCWGNVDYGIMELDQKNGESQVMAYAWDLETNTRQTKIFTVKHERHTKKGVTKLTDPRDIYETVANQGARRVRACILGIIPGDIVDKAMEKCEKTLMSGHSEPLKDRLMKALNMFKTDYGVSKDLVEDYFGYNIDAFTERDYVRLGGIFKALRDGMAKIEDYFDVRSTAPTVSKTEDAFKAALEGGDSPDAGTEQPKLPLD